MERELWKSLYLIAFKLDKPWGHWKYSTADIVVVYLWCVICDRPMCWGVQKGNWPADLCPACLPSQATLSRRMRQADAQELMTAIERAWGAVVGQTAARIRIIDGKPLTVSGVSKDQDAGYGQAAGGKAKGYKLFAVWAAGPLPVAWGLARMNLAEATMARQLIPDLPGRGYLLGDTAYDSNTLFDLAHQADHQLLTPKRRGGLGHRRHSPFRLRSIKFMQRRIGKRLFQFRRQIERDFGNLTSFAGGLTCLPAWVRRFPRVRNWVQAKLLVNAARWFRKRPEMNALA
jgi:Transposase DDE domain